MSAGQEFEVKPLRKGALEGVSDEDKKQYKLELEAVHQDLTATSVELNRHMKRTDAMLTAVSKIDKESKELESRIHDARLKLLELNKQLNGSSVKAEVGESGPPTPQSRLSIAFYGLTTTYGPTTLHRESLEICKKQIAEIKLSLTELVDHTLPQLESDLKEAGAPWIEGQGLIRD